MRNFRTSKNLEVPFPSFLDQGNKAQEACPFFKHQHIF